MTERFARRSLDQNTRKHGGVRQGSHSSEQAGYGRPGNSRDEAQPKASQKRLPNSGGENEIHLRKNKEF